MLSLTKLKNLLQLDDVKGLLIYIPIGMILIFLSIEYLFFIPIYILYLFYIFKQNKILFKYVLIISVFFLLIYLIKYISYRTYNIKDLYKGIVVDKNDNSILIKYRLNYIKCYIKNEDINIGDKILFNIKETDINERSVEGVFSYLKYKYSKNIKIEGKLKSFQKLKSFNIYKLKRLLVNYIESFGPNSSDYLKKLVLGMSSFSDELNSNISDAGIIYLYAISGLHISLLSLYIKKIFRLFNMREEIISIILIIFLFFYLLMCSKSSSIERAILMISIKEIFTLLKFKFNKLDIMSISFIIIHLFNPFSLFSISTYLTYLSTLIIFFYDTKNNIKLSIVLIIFSTPLILYTNSKISIFIFLFSIFFGVIFSKFFIPFTYLILFLPFASFLYEKAVFVLNQVISLLNDLNIMINFSIVNPFYLFLIYVLLFLLFKFKHFLKGKVVVISLLSFIIFLNYLHGVVSFIPTVKVIDVGQGDSILIRDYNNTYLIDTGVSDDYHTTISYLKHNNIKKIDYLF